MSIGIYVFINAFFQKAENNLAITQSKELSQNILSLNSRYEGMAIALASAPKTEVKEEASRTFIYYAGTIKEQINRYLLSDLAIEDIYVYDKQHNQLITRNYIFRDAETVLRDKGLTPYDFANSSNVFRKNSKTYLTVHQGEELTDRGKQLLVAVYDYPMFFNDPAQNTVYIFLKPEGIIDIISPLVIDNPVKPYLFLDGHIIDFSSSSDSLLELVQNELDSNLNNIGKISYSKTLRNDNQKILLNYRMLDRNNVLITLQNAPKVVNQTLGRAFILLLCFFGFSVVLALFNFYPAKPSDKKTESDRTEQEPLCTENLKQIGEPAQDEEEKSEFLAPPSLEENMCKKKPIEDQSCELIHSSEEHAIVRFIEANISSPQLNALTIAEELHYSEKYIFKIIKDETGQTLAKYINQRRLKLAAELLTKNNLPITDIAFQVGFSSYNSFYRAFQRSYGVSPSEYRNRDA